jgi:hypothetical protein
MVRCLPSSLYSVLLPTKIAENMLIEKLLYNPFSVRPLHDILRRVNRGRHTPPLTNLITHYKTKTERYTRHFDTSQYLEVDWLAGYETENFIVGPVYFFVTIMNGFSDLNHWSSAQQEHSKSQTHVYCYLQLKLFGKQQSVDLLLDAQHRNDVTRRGKKMKRNR